MPGTVSGVAFRFFTTHPKPLAHLKRSLVIHRQRRVANVELHELAHGLNGDALSLEKISHT